MSMRWLLPLLIAVSLSSVSLGPVLGAATASCVKIGAVQPSGEKVSLDPANVIGTEAVMLINSTYNRLLDMDSNLQVQPELAESWQSSSDASEWTFNLRRGVKFHDGKELTADDVIWSFQRLIDPATGSEAASTLAFLKEASITAPDRYTVRFKLARSLAELPTLLTNKNTFIVQKGATTETLRLKGVGTGPFVPVDFALSQQVRRLVRNRNYWEPGLPRAECLEIYMIPEPTTRNAALQSGQIDVSEGVAFGTIRALETDTRIKLVESPGPAYYMTFSMWIDTPPFDDARVRRALKLIVDRQKVLDTIILGRGVIGDDNPIPPNSPAAVRSTVPKHDVEQAKRLLAEAGYGPAKPLKVDLWAAEIRPGLVGLAQLFKEMAAQAGVEVNVIVAPASEFLDKVWLKQPFIVDTWGNRPVAEALALPYRSTSLVNETHWRRLDYDALLDKAGATSNPAVRVALYKLAAKMLTDDGGVITPAFVKIVAATRANCEGYTPHAQAIRVDLKRVRCSR
jgi:peptide/nickel transport system substrate-binding protein